MQKALKNALIDAILILSRQPHYSLSYVNRDLSLTKNFHTKNIYGHCIFYLKNYTYCNSIENWCAIVKKDYCILVI
jgi:hypothetical protein